MIKGFKEFIMRGNVIDLAVGVMIGGAFNTIVKALVDDIITPFIGALGGTPDFSGITFTINKSVFTIGSFINAVISFLIIASVIYFFIVVPMNKLRALSPQEKPMPSEKTCPECLSNVPVKATKCKYCTSILKK